MLKLSSLGAGGWRTKAWLAGCRFTGLLSSWRRQIGPRLSLHASSYVSPWKIGLLDAYSPWRQSYQLVQFLLQASIRALSSSGLQFGTSHKNLRPVEVFSIPRRCHCSSGLFELNLFIWGKGDTTFDLRRDSNPVNRTAGGTRTRHVHLFIAPLARVEPAFDLRRDSNRG